MVKEYQMDLDNNDVKSHLAGLFSDVEIVPSAPPSDIPARVVTAANGVERYRMLVEDLPVGIYRITAGPQSKLLMANQAFFDIFGVDRRESLDQDHAESADPNLTPGPVTESELQLKRKDGTSIWCSIMSRAILKNNGEVAFYDCLVRDITKMKQAEQSLWAADPWERLALNALQEAVLVITLDRRIVGANLAAEQIFEYTQAELSYLAPQSLYADKYAEMDQAIQLLAERGGESRLSIEVRRKGGSAFLTEHTLRLIRNSSGQPVAVLCFIRSLGERKLGLTARLTSIKLPTATPMRQACVYLGLFDDSKTHESLASESNYCHAGLPPIPVEPAFQTGTCLGGNWGNCLSYQAALKRKQVAG